MKVTGDDEIIHIHTASGGRLDALLARRGEPRDAAGRAAALDAAVAIGLAAMERYAARRVVDDARELLRFSSTEPFWDDGTADAKGWA
jgi:hypothetical protein